MLKPITLYGEQKKVLFLPPTDPIQIKGVAGSGKTTVALYRAKHLLETQSNLFQEAQVAIFTYNKTLVAYIKAVRDYISGGYQKDTEELKQTTGIGLNVEVTNFHKWAYHFIKANGLNLYRKTVQRDQQVDIIENLKSKFSSDSSNISNKRAEFFIEEISWIKGKLISTEKEYLEVKRTGRGTADRVSKADKSIIWNIYCDYSSWLDDSGKVDFDDYAILALGFINNNEEFKPLYTHLIIDEAQDLSKAQILTLSKIVSPETKSLSIIADAAQRIYKSGFTWSEVGINVRGGRTIEFKNNYRNTIPIVNAAISLLAKESDKEDFTRVKKARKGVQKPVIGYFNDWNAELSYLNQQVMLLRQDDKINSTVVLHRNNQGIENVGDYLASNGHHIEYLKNVNTVDYNSDSIKLCTLSSIKGLEFDNVFILDLNDDVIPYPPGFNDENDEFHISTERRLLYTAMTRARENLYLLSSGIPSSYLAEIDEKFINLVMSSSSPDLLIDDDLPF